MRLGFYISGGPAAVIPAKRGGGGRLSKCAAILSQVHLKAMYTDLQKPLLQEYTCNHIQSY